MANQSLIPGERARGNPFSRFAESNPFTSLQKEMNRLFEDFWPLPTTGSGPSVAFERPRLDVKETDAMIEVQADLPGVDIKDVDITLANGILTIKGEKKSEKEDKSANYLHVERSWGSFQRSIELPVEVQADKCEAEFANGVLTVKLAKAASAKETSKKIEVKPAAKKA